MHYFDPLDQEQKKKGKIRGPVNRWDIKGNLRVGFHSSINGRLKSRGPVTLGSYCAVGGDCRLIATSHDTQVINLQIWLQIEVRSKKGAATKGPIQIGHNVWIGDNVSVMSGVTVGNGAVLATGAVVTTDVAPYSVVARVPAKHMRFRFSRNVRDQLEQIKWWEWDEQKIQRNRAFFDVRIEPGTEIDLSELIVD